jgi:Mce-associated membrane protein
MSDVLREEKRINGTRVKAASGATTTTRETPTRKAPVRKAAVRKAPVRKAPVRKAPVHASPDGQEPTRTSPTRTSPTRTSGGMATSELTAAALETALRTTTIPVSPSDEYEDEETWLTDSDVSAVVELADDDSLIEEDTESEADSELDTSELDTSELDTEVADDGSPRIPRLSRLTGFVRKHLVSVGIGVVALALAIALVLTTLGLQSKSSLESARSSGLASAKTYAVEVASYNYNNLNHDFGVVLGNSTPSFRSSFSQSSNALKSTLIRYHAIAKATVVATGVVSASTSNVVVLVFLDQTITNTMQKNATTDRSQVEISLNNVGGKWLINNVTLL